MLMDAEPLRFEETLAERKASALESLGEISEGEMLALISKLFPDGMHPWIDGFTNFIHEHRAELALQGRTMDGYSFVYFPMSRKGIWYEYRNDKCHGVGLLGQGGLRALAEITGAQV
ncbi:hypothetical protein BH09VER1_BH09VER1_46180 [soil metagenome]